MKTSEQLNSKGLLKTAQKCVADGKATVDLPRTLDDFFTGGHWNKVPTASGKPFVSFCEFASSPQPHGLGLGQYNGHITASQAWALCSGHAKLRAELLKLVVDDVQPLAKHGTNQHSGGGDNITSKPQRGTGAEYLLRKIRTAADGGCPKATKVMEQLRNGELSSVNKAAIKAGVKKAKDSDKDRDPVDRLKMYWKRTNKKQRAAFIDFLVNSGEIDGAE
jgi:hypothetical protein